MQGFFYAISLVECITCIYLEQQHSRSLLHPYRLSIPAVDESFAANKHHSNNSIFNQQIRKSSHGPPLLSGLGDTYSF